MQLRNIVSNGIVIVLLSAVFSCGTDKTNQKSKITTELDSLFVSAVENEEIPGAVVHIVKNKQEVYHKAFGYQNINEGIEMKTNSIFRLASMTKALTAVSILQLYEKGLLDLNDNVSKFIPEFQNPKLLVSVLVDSTFTSTPAKSEITIHQLLTHTSGIGYGFQNDSYNALIIKNNISEGFCEDERTSLENTKKIANLPLLAEPGEKNIYSLSYDVLGTVIEIISGLRYDDYIKKNILEPLEMNESYFIIPKSKHNRLIEVYQPTTDNNGLMLTSYHDINYPILEDQQFFSGGADLSSTASDYYNFMEMIIYKGVYKNKRILGEKYIDMMLTKQTNIDDGNSDQGFAAWVTNKKGAKKGPLHVGAYGFGGFFDTYTWTDPEKNFTATLFLQMYPTNGHNIHKKYQEIVYGIIEDL